MDKEKRPAIAPAALAAMIDHTFLRPDGDGGAIGRLCDEAAEWHFGCVMVNPCEVKNAAARLAGSGVRVGTVIGFPLGQSTLTTMLFEANEAIENGAGELDFVMNVRRLREAFAPGGAPLPEKAPVDSLPITSDYRAMLRVLRGSKPVTTKLIIETCYLDDAQKAFACRMAKAAGFDFVKTSTGFGTGGATAGDVALMRECVGPEMGVKAAGGIRDLDTALALIAAGANRLGCSAGVALMRALAKAGE